MTPEGLLYQDLYAERWPPIEAEVHCANCLMPLTKDRDDRWVHHFSGTCTRAVPVRREVQA